MESKFKKGDIVFLKEDVTFLNWRNNDFESFEVLDITPDGDVVVSFINLNNKKSTKVLKADSIIIESEAEQKMSSLEEEFKMVQSAVIPKIKEINFLFNEAVKIAKDNGFTLRDLCDDINFRTMIRNAGWSSSYLSCY